MIEERQVYYQTGNTYSRLNSFSEKTKNVWVVFHGIGYLSRYFLRHFKSLNPDENYIIAPQASSKYYLKNEYKYVGASWLTKENTQTEMENVLQYLDEVYKAENLAAVPKLYILGFSQGVSIAARWVARRKINCSKLILMSGKIPHELAPSDFEFLKENQTYLVYGKQDHFFDSEVFEKEKDFAASLFKNLEIIPFEGGHEVNEKIIQDF